MHIDRSDALYFKGLLSAEKVFDFVHGGAASFPDVQAINANKALEVADYTIDKKRINAEEITRCYQDGATIVVSEAHKKFQPLQDMCTQFSRDFRMLCQTNAYLSPAGNQGFYSHYDTHDVFVLQVAGRKKFRFYSSGVKLPFPEDTYSPENKADSELMDVVEVSAGDTLYIPRGIVHDAIASDGEPSLHITLGAFPFVMRDLLQEIVQVAAECDVRWRTSVDLKPQAHDPAQLYEQAGSIFTDAIYAEALSRLADEVALAQLTEQIAVPEFSLQSRVTVVHSRVFGVERLQDILKLRVAGKVLCFEAPMSAAVEAILSVAKIRVNEIPALDDEQRLALCQQMAEAGAIAISNEA